MVTTEALENCFISQYTDGNWTNTETEWIWKNTAYTMLELADLSKEYQMFAIGNQEEPQYTFKQDGARKITLRAVNQDEKWELTIHKTDADGNPLANAVFGIYVKLDAKDTPMTQMGLDQKVEVFNVTVPIDLSMELGGDTWQLVDLITSDEDGCASKEGLLSDEVLIREVQSPAGYVLEEEYREIKVQTETHVEITLINRPFSLKVVKTYEQAFLNDLSETHKGAVVGAEFTLYAAEDMKREVPLDVLLTDENGEAILGPASMDHGLKPGNYVLVETDAPVGYQKTEDLFFAIDATGNVYNSNGEAIEELKAVDSIALGSIQITKVGDVIEAADEEKAWYNKIGEWFFKVWNVLTGKTLEGAKFSIYAAENICVPGTDDLILEKDEQIAEVVTDKDGRASVSGLPVGSYYVIETEAPEGYQLNAERRDVLLAARETDQGDTTIVTYELTHENIYRKVNVTVIKTDAEDDSILLEGAVFGIFASGTLEDVNDKTIFEEGDLLDTAISNAEGKADFTIDLPYGEYIVRELKAPVGYEMDEASEYVITVAENDYADSAIARKTIEVVNEKILVDISVSKEWDDEEDKDGIRPEKVTIRLMIGEKEVNKVELSKENGWMYTFEKLVAYDKGEKIAYTIREDEVAGYRTTISGSEENGYVVTNTHTPEPEAKPDPTPDKPEPTPDEPDEFEPIVEPEKDPNASSRPLEGNIDNSVESAHGNQQSTSVDTGDLMNPGVWACLLVIALAMIVFMLRINHLRRED